MEVYEAMAQAFLDEGVDVVFSLMGDGNMYWLSRLINSGRMRNVHVRHENAAVAMADGYARTTRHVGVATVTCGPGLTQATTAIIGAARYGVSLVIFAGDTAPGDVTGLQHFNHRAFAALCGIEWVPVTTAGEALPGVRTAFARARALRRPVLLSVAGTLKGVHLPGQYNYAPAPPQPARLLPASDVLDSAAGLIASSRRPIVIVGQGAADPAALKAITALGDRVGALYATTLLAKGALGDSPYDLGVVGGFSVPAAVEHLRRADLGIAVGTSLHPYTVYGCDLFPRARVLHINDQPAASLAYPSPASLYVQGDATLTVQAIDDLLAGAEYRSPGMRPGFRLADYDPFDDSAQGRPGADEQAMDPRDLVAELERGLPDDALVFCGAGHFWTFTNKGLTGRRGRRYFHGMGFGSIGQALPMAIGAAVGSPQPRLSLSRATRASWCTCSSSTPRSVTASACSPLSSTTTQWEPSFTSFGSRGIRPRVAWCRRPTWPASPLHWAVVARWCEHRRNWPGSCARSGGTACIWSTPRCPAPWSTPPRSARRPGISDAHPAGLLTKLLLD